MSLASLMGIDRTVEKKSELFHALPPEEVQRRAKLSGSTLDALAAERVLREKEAAKQEPL